MAPSVGRSSPAIKRSSVVLPEPDGPSSAISSPERMSSETSWSAGKRSNSLRTLVTRTSIPNPRVKVSGRGLPLYRRRSAFQAMVQHERDERQPGQKCGDREGAGCVVFIVEDFDM